MTITPATRLGVYEITAPLGEGGMGQVWRARDTKLDRDVAIKVLPEAFANDADRLARFTREAKWQVSTAEGAAPRWRADGKELYFLAPDATMMAVPVTASGASFERSVVSAR